MSLPVFTNPVDEIQEAGFRNWGENAANIHTDRVYTALINASLAGYSPWGHRVRHN